MCQKYRIKREEWGCLIITELLFIIGFIVSLSYLIVYGLKLTEIKQSINPWSPGLKETECLVIDTTYLSQRCSEQLRISYSEKSIYFVKEGLNNTECALQWNTTLPCVYSSSNPDTFQTLSSYNQAEHAYQSLMDEKGTAKGGVISLSVMVVLLIIFNVWLWIHIISTMKLGWS